MRYWYFDERFKKATGPHLDVVLARQPGFGPESKVAPEGGGAAAAWRPAKDFPELKSFFPSAPPAAPAKPKTP